MGPAVYLHHASSQDHDPGPGLPERVDRIPAIEKAMAEQGWCGMERLEAPAAPEATVEAVHAPEYVAQVRGLSERGGGFLDIETVASAGSYRAALHAAGGAARLADLLLTGQASTAISALRPPGHHAEGARGMGFCLFNNVAIAAQHALDAHGLDRVLIFDWDVHHGNGTNDIFHTSDRVLFASIHQSPLYPGTGPAADAGSGAGEGHTVNLPVPAGSGDEVFESMTEHVIGALIRAFEPQLVLVSAGFDAHHDDPLADCQVTEAGYAAMTASLRRACGDVGAPLGAVLEGGYDLGALSRSTVATARAMVAPDPGAEEVAPLHPLAEQALGRVAAHWPQVAATPS